MDVSGWLSRSGATPGPLAATRPQGSAKRLVGRLLAMANAHADCLGHLREDFYALKRRLLQKYGTPCGTDWQEVTRECFGCELCSGRYRHDGSVCDGKGVWERVYVPLARTRLGGVVFHTPGVSWRTRPDAPVTFRGRVPRRPVREADANAALLTLCLWFDRDLFRRAAARLMAVEVPEVPF